MEMIKEMGLAATNWAFKIKNPNLIVYPLSGGITQQTHFYILFLKVPLSFYRPFSPKVWAVKDFVWLSITLTEIMSSLYLSFWLIKYLTKHVDIRVKNFVGMVTVRSYIGWRGKQSILYKDVTTST